MSDKDLRFLNECTNEELDVLVKIILDRFSETLSVDEKYKKYAPNHKMYVDVIYKELIAFGTRGGELVNIILGDKPYREIVYDVCKKMEVSVDLGASIERMEQALMEMMLKKAWDSYSEEEREEFLKEMGEDAQTFLQMGGNPCQCDREDDFRTWLGIWCSPSNYAWHWRFCRTHWCDSDGALRSL